MGGLANAVWRGFFTVLCRISGFKAGIAGLGAFLVAACSTVTGPSLEANAGTLRLKPAAVSDLPGWNSDNQFQALAAFTRSCKKMSGDPWTRICANAEAAADTGGNNSARAFFQTNFDAYRLLLPGQKRGFLTGYFQPEVRGSLTQTQEFQTPIYRKPEDLVVIGAGTNAPQVDKRLKAARRTQAGALVAYYSRAEIEQGALRNQGLELVYLADPVDAFFIHVQGSARIALTDGTILRIGFAAKNGHPYTSIGKVLLDKGELPRDEVTMATIRQWFSRNPGRVDEITWQNKSFIFFREITEGDPSSGPVGAQGIALTAGRSLAVDRNFHELGLPFWIDAEIPDGRGGTEPFRQLMIAQDTGSAILGAGRGDIFFGSGAAAGRRAGPTQHNGDFYILLPKGAPLPAWAK